MRLDKILANTGYGSRTEVKEWIKKGFVSVDGRIIQDPGFQVLHPKQSQIVCQNHTLPVQQHLYLMLHKPEKYLTALKDLRYPCIGDLISPTYLAKNIAPVGRLDYNTTGFLLLTNNGQLSYRLTNPKWEIRKTYWIEYKGEPLNALHEEECAKGLTLREEGKEPQLLKPAYLERLEKNTCKLILTEGKTHQVKRMLASFGRSVTVLHRVQIGNLPLDSTLKAGEIRPLWPEEINLLFAECNLDPQFL